MGAVHQNQPPAKLVIGIIASRDFVLGNVEKRLEASFGPVDFRAGPIDFSPFTQYYQKEMGRELTRHFVAFENLVPRDSLVDLKHATQSLEAAFSTEGKRLVNLDPGILSLGQLFLASTKDHFFRIYLGSGIFAEVTLYFKNEAFHDFPWTFRDYQTPEYKGIFFKIRKIYKKQLETKKENPNQAK